MAELVALKTRTVETNEETVALLREFLDMAENGEIISVAIAAVEPGGASQTRASSSDHLQELLGALAILQFRMIANRHGQ